MISFADNTILDTIISLVLIYALLSLLVSVLLEWWNQFRKTRSKFLKKVVLQLLNDPLNTHFGEHFYNHYLIRGLYSKELKKLPQYISSRLFAEVLIDIIANLKQHDQSVKAVMQGSVSAKTYTTEGDAPPATVIERFNASLEKLNDSPFVDTIRSFWDKSGGDYDKLKILLSTWFDDHMDQISGWYKQQMRNKLIFFGFAVTIGLNVDSLHLVRIISLDSKLRNDLVLTAENVSDQYDQLADSTKNSTQELEKIVTRVTGVSSVRDEDGNLYTKKHIFDMLKPSTTDSIDYRAIIDRLITGDSLSRKYQEQANHILDLATSLNIPIGWDSSAVPISWFNHRKSIVRSEVKDTKNIGIVRYLNKRNTPTFANIVLYIVGIIISGFSLSVGAPFWFETLVKLVNIRRTGRRPEMAAPKM
jgi:hypothetical protein